MPIAVASAFRAPSAANGTHCAPRTVQRHQQHRQQHPTPAACPQRVATSGGPRRRLCARSAESGSNSNPQDAAAPAAAVLAQAEEPQAVQAVDTPAAPSPPLPSQPQPPRLWRTLLESSWRLVQRNLWPLLTAHAIADAAVFLLHRISHRATNAAAVTFLLGGALTPAAIGNMWWLSVDPALANFQTGYQPLTFAFFLLTFPIVVGIKSWATLATILFCQQAGKEDDAPVPLWQPLRGIKQGFKSLGAVKPQMGSLWGRMYFVELLVASAVVPLTFASLAVITIPLTLPIILDLQGAGTAAVVEGASGMAAVKRSRELVRSIRWQLAIPFVGLAASRRLAEAAKTALVNAMPPRFYQELVEIPLVVLVGGTLLSLLVARLQDVLPFVAYTEAASLETDSKNGAAVAQQNGSGAADTASPA